MFGLKTGLAAVAILAATGLVKADTLGIDFGGNGVTDPGFTKYAPANFLTNEAESWSIGDGLTLSFNLINNYTLPGTTNPVVADGLFTNTTSTYTISGLHNGQSVTLYAIDAWDGAVRAAGVSINGNADVDTATANDDTWLGTHPGFTASEADFVDVGSATAGGMGTITGTVDDIDSRPEGQVGAFIVAVPEPASLGFVGMGVSALLMRRRRTAQ